MYDRLLQNDRSLFGRLDFFWTLIAMFVVFPIEWAGTMVIVLSALNGGYQFWRLRTDRGGKSELPAKTQEHRPLNKREIFGLVVAVPILVWIVAWRNGWETDDWRCAGWLVGIGVFVALIAFASVSLDSRSTQEKFIGGVSPIVLFLCVTVFPFGAYLSVRNGNWSSAISAIAVATTAVVVFMVQRESKRQLLATTDRNADSVGDTAK